MGGSLDFRGLGSNRKADGMNPGADRVKNLFMCFRARHLTLITPGSPLNNTLAMTSLSEGVSGRLGFAKKTHFQFPYVK